MAMQNTLNEDTLRIAFDKKDANDNELNTTISSNLQSSYDLTNEARSLIMSGGGNISWGLLQNNLKWTTSFAFLPVSENVASTDRFVNLAMPAIGVTDTAGVEHASADGITINAWESLWFLHVRGQTAYLGNSWKVLSFTDAAIPGYFADENAYLIATHNGDSGSVYLRNGLVLRQGGIIAAGSGVMLPLPGSQALVATDAIVTSMDVVQISAAAAITLTSAPTIADGLNGQKVMLINTGGFDITLQDQGTLVGSNLRLSAAGITLTPRDSVQLMYLSAVGDWVQVGSVVGVL